MSRASFLINENHRLSLDLKKAALHRRSFLAHAKGASHQRGAACAIRHAGILKLIPCF